MTDKIIIFILTFLVIYGNNPILNKQQTMKEDITND